MNSNRAIGGLEVSGIAVSQSNKIINLRCLVSFIPTGNAKESSHHITIDEEKEKSLGSIDGCRIDYVCSSQIVPINSSDLLINDLDSFRDGGWLLGIPLGVESTVLSKTLGMGRECQ